MPKEFADSNKNKSPHQRKVEKFVDYLNTQLMDIPVHCWFNFSVECMEVIDKYTSYQPAEDNLPQSNNACGSRSSFMQAKGGDYNYQQEILMVVQVLTGDLIMELLLSKVCVVLMVELPVLCLGINCSKPPLDINLAVPSMLP